MAINEPKATRAALDVINNTYVIRNGLLFEYYPIECEVLPIGGKFIKMVTSPSVMVPGTAIVEKKLYEVSLEDLFRRRINVAKRLIAEPDVNIRKPSKKATTSISQPVTHTVERVPSSLFGSEVGQVADLAWENQVNSLLETLHSEEGEEFEIESVAQSGQSNAGSTASDLFEDT